MTDLTDRDPTEHTRAEISRLSASGDLLDVARQMREMGVESLLFARRDGRITEVVTDRQIAHLAAGASASPTVWLTPPGFVPAQGIPADEGVVAEGSVDESAADVERSEVGLSEVDRTVELPRAGVSRR